MEELEDLAARIIRLLEAEKAFLEKAIKMKLEELRARPEKEAFNSLPTRMPTPINNLQKVVGNRINPNAQKNPNK